MDIAFLTGAAGFVGANLARLLVEKGFRVRALLRPSSSRRSLEGLDVDVVFGDILDVPSLRRAAAGARYVFHVAADYRLWVPDAREMLKTNVEGTVNVLKTAGECGAERIVHCSSVAAVRPPRDRRPVDETSQYSSDEDIVSAYKKSKFLSEKAALELAGRGLPVVIVNPAAPVGPFDAKPTPTGKIILDFINGRLPSYIDTGLNIVDVRDVALGHYLAALNGRLGQRYILGGENLTFKQVLDILSEETGLPAPRFKTPYPLAYLFGALDTARAKAFGGEPFAPLEAVRMARYYMWFDCAKARRELGFPLSDARKALKDAADWFIANGYAEKNPENLACRA